MSELFPDDDDRKRDRLRALGWHPAGGMLMGRTLWRRPDGLALMNEEDAFSWLQRHEAQDKKP